MTNNQKDFNQNINAERTNLRPSSTSEQSINHENILNESIATQQQDALSTYLQNHRVPDGVKFVDLEKLSNNAEFLTDLVSDYDRQELESVLESGSKYGVMFIDDDNVAIHNISKKELNTLSNLKDYEFDPAYKSVAKEMVQLAPNAPDTTIDLGDSISFDLNAFEDTFLSFNEDKKSRNAFAQPGKVFINGSKAHTENIDNATSAGINSNAQKEGKVLGYISARKSFKMNKINKTPKMNNKALSSADYKIENYTKLADEANWLNNEGKKNRDTVARPNITKEKEEFKHKLEQYPVIVNSKHDGEANIELLHFKDRLKDLHLNLAYGSDLPSDKYKDMKISKNALYVTGKQLQKPFYLGESLEEAKITMSSDSEALDYGELYAKQYGYGILSNKQIGSTTPVYAHEEFEEVPTDEDALDYAKIYNSRTNTSRYTQDKLDKDTEKVFLEKPIYSQWFIQRDKAEKAYEDLEKLGFPIDYQSKESKRLDNLSRKISPATIHKLENAYVSTRNIYFDDETSEVKNVSLLSNNTKEKIERNGKKYLSQEHAKRVLKHKRLER
ncbi:hypothetical protein [Lactobacillus taiwanensis]|uniref:hypothetical protein n=1 Tax=Lactobacillus taiwanensis TaxID=508451 RepID=UPI00129D6BA3|nr:hypothetical protein [Lactobacillus taiwanensis]MRM99458.1 hypothetical protein [Lactobacillus taiwanensis]